MFRNLFLSVLFGTVLSALGCGGSAPANSAANSNTNANTVIKMDPANMPPGLSGSPVTLSANTPGIPANVGPLPKGATPTPGIPSPAELKKKPKPGLTPTPGIPDAATIRKQLGMPPKNVNASPSSDVPMMKKNRNN